MISFSIWTFFVENSDRVCSFNFVELQWDRFLFVCGFFVILFIFDLFFVQWNKTRDFFKFCKKLYKKAIVRLYDAMCTHWLYSIQQFQLIPILFGFCFDFSGILSAIKDIYHVLLASSQRYNLMVSGILFFFSFSYLQFSQRWQGHMLKKKF